MYDFAAFLHCYSRNRMHSIEPEPEPEPEPDSLA